MGRFGVWVLIAACAAPTGESTDEPTDAATDGATDGVSDAPVTDVVVTDPGPVDSAALAADADADGSPDADDCGPMEASVRPGAVERPANRVDDDCDGDVDEAPTPATFRRAAASGTLDGVATDVTASLRVMPDGVDGPFTDMVLWLAEGGGPTGDPVGSGTDEWGYGSLTLPVADLTLRATNPASRQLWVLMQRGDDTFAGEVAVEVGGLPARTALALIDGALYGVIPSALAFRPGNSVYLGDEYFGPSTEISPGVWSFGNAPAALSATPYLLYFTAGAHPETGAEAHWTTFNDAGAAGVYVSSNGMVDGLIYYVTPTDLDGDGGVDADDLSRLDLAALPTP